LIDIIEDYLEENDLMAPVKRLSDGKQFEIGLSWLTTKKAKGKDYQLLDDYATWVVNYSVTLMFNFAAILRRLLRCELQRFPTGAVDR
jgi:hypothetical protein